MKSREEIINYCLSLHGSLIDYPFDDKTPVLRHRENKKMFALLTSGKDGIPLLNLKCEPMQADFWRSVYKDVIPGYHMNKTHWNSIVIGGDVAAWDLRQMVNHSHSLTAPRGKKKK